jgi:hypothetical protein
VGALAAGAQLSEHTMFAVIVGASTLQGAEGASLDRWGEIVGEQRGGLDDEDLRLFIGLRIIVNTRHPSEDAMWELISTAVAPYAVGPALPLSDGVKFYVTSVDALPDPVRTRLASLVASFRPAGKIVKVLETIPERALFEWEAGGPSLITDDEADADTVIPDLIYSGRGGT